MIEELGRIWEEVAMAYFKVVSHYLPGEKEEHLNPPPPEFGLSVLGVKMEPGYLPNMQQTRCEETLLKHHDTTVTHQALFLQSYFRMLLTYLLTPLCRILF
jgi:hypothetical protein